MRRVGRRSKRVDTSSEPREVGIRDETIRLGQLLKLADLVDTGADAKPLVAEGLVAVNGEVESRRGRQLRDGDVVAVQGAGTVRVRHTG